MLFPCCRVFLVVFLLSLSCISYHVIMCIAFAYVFVSCIRAFSPLSVLQSRTPISSGAPMSPGVPFYLFSCAGVKRFRIGPRLVMWPWFTTSRPPVKFCTIWTSYDAPTVNRGTEKASCVLQPNTLPIWPKTHQNPLHHLERSITIAWPKTAPPLDSPSSSYAYIYFPHSKSRVFPPLTLDPPLSARPDTSAGRRTTSAAVCSH